MAPPEPEPVFRERMVGEHTRQRQSDIEHQVRLLGIHRQHLALLRAQARQLGAHTPTYIQMQIAERREEIASIKRVLRSDYGERVEDLAGDE